MAEDFDDFMDEEYEDEEFVEDFDDEDFDDFEFSPEDIAEIKRAKQDAAMGFTYEMLFGPDRKPFDVRCNKCKREGNMLEKPFPHRFDCPMRDRVKD